MSDFDPQPPQSRRAAVTAQAAAFDRLPPHSIEAEQGVLGCCLIAPKEALLAAREKFRDRAGFFYDLRHQTLFALLLAMDGRGEAIDLITVRQRLKDAGQLDEIGGLPYLTALVDATPSPENLPFYADIVVEKHLLRRTVATCTEIIGRVYAEERAGDVETLLDEAEQAMLSLGQDREEADAVTDMRPHVERAVAVMETSFKHRNQGFLLGMPTGFSYYDKKTNGLQDKTLTLIGGRPSTGKTSWLVTLLLHLGVTCKIPVGFLSMEMSKEEITLRMLCNLAGVELRKVHSGMISQHALDALTLAVPKLAAAPIFIDDTPSMTPSQMRTHARRLKQRFGVRMLGIDHLHEVSDPAHKGDEQRDAKAAVVSAKWIAKVLGLPVVALAQLSREFEKEKGKRRPRMSDLRGHGANEQVADIIGILYRDEDREEEAKEQGWVNTNDDGEEVKWMNSLEVCKQRNGPTGPVHFIFDRPSMRYVDATYNTGSQSGGERRAKQQEIL